MNVRILKSPYYCVKKGSVGTLESKKFEGDKYEVWRVKVGKESRLFRPCELKELEERE